MYSNTWEIALRQQSVQFGRPECTFDEDDDLIELQLVQQLVQFPVLLFLVELHIVLLKTMQGELGLVIDIDLERRLHKLLADGADLLGEGSREHHDLLLLRCSAENFLHVTTHI